jgi:hypothetical protein
MPALLAEPGIGPVSAAQLLPRAAKPVEVDLDTGQQKRERPSQQRQHSDRRVAVGPVEHWGSWW